MTPAEEEAKKLAAIQDAIEADAKKEFWLEHKLQKPIEPFGKVMEVVKLRNPTTEEIRKLDDPFHHRSDGGMQMNSENAARWIELLGGLGHKGCNMLYFKDFQTLKVEVVSFFGESMGDTTSE